MKRSHNPLHTNVKIKQLWVKNIKSKEEEMRSHLKKEELRNQAFFRILKKERWKLENSKYTQFSNFEKGEK